VTIQHRVIIVQRKIKKKFNDKERRVASPVTAELFITIEFHKTVLIVSVRVRLWLSSSSSSLFVLCSTNAG